MPYAVTHILVPIIILDLLKKRRAWKGKISLHTIFVAGVFGLVPDLDIALEFLLYGIGNPADLHRTFTHSFSIPFVLAVIALLLWRSGRARKQAAFLGVAAFGWALHVFLDILSGGVVTPFVPFSSWGIEVGILVNEAQPLQLQTSILAALDAVVFLVWLWHEEKYKKLKDFF
ncbi:MAG: metal-dependent hydrolase [Candidatus Aenigmarchaeota archaeon]|nr:metal-dependent hydrolase [Candidatus Aenigmarchaeota archaeon]